VTTGIANAVGVRRTESALVIWSEGKATGNGAAAALSAPPPSKTAAEPAAALFGAAAFFDAGSQGCGEGPLDKIAATLRKMEPGQTLEVRATDPSVAVDLPAWCRMVGHTLVEQRDDRYVIRRK
jgi:tRNA 2-thiouridine synthesizing protein A